jgi:hypothetical protein
MEYPIQDSNTAAADVHHLQNGADLADWRADTADLLIWRCFNAIALLGRFPEIRKLHA